MSIKLNQTGRSMVEVIGVIGIITILSIGAWKSVDYGMGFYRANEVKVSAEEMIKKIEQFAVWERSYANVGAQGFLDANGNVSTRYCEADGLDFPASFCNGNNLDASKISIHKGQWTHTAMPNQGTWNPQFDNDNYHFSIVFRVGREACRQLRKAQSEGKLWSATIRHVAPLYRRNGQVTAFCSKYHTNQFVFIYPR